MSDAIAKIVMFLIVILVFGGMIFSSVYNAIKVSQLQSELSTVNKTWQNSNQSTSSALKLSDFIKKQYSKRFYTALTLVKEPNSESMCLNENLSYTMGKVLDLPPSKLKKYDGAIIERDDLDD